MNSNHLLRLIYGKIFLEWDIAMRRTGVFRDATLILVSLLMCLCACDPLAAKSGRKNVVTAYLGHAERQTETADQRRELAKALSDMLRKSPAVLRRTRYTDYEGHVGTWSLPELLRHYLVPNPPAGLDENRFYGDVSAPSARVAIRKQLENVKRALEAAPD